MIHFDWAEAKLPCGSLRVSEWEGMHVDFRGERDSLQNTCVTKYK